jgi:ubiquinone/menaquinone biosynthesis C-methylase UbiE
MTDPSFAKHTKEVEEWWDKNPFTLGLSDKSDDLVGRIDPENMDLHYFQEIDRKFRKHTYGGLQDDGAPLFSKFIDYASLKGKDVLDIAVGSGFSMVGFVAAGAKVTGIDLTAFAVTQTKRNLEVRGLSGTVLKMDAQHLQFPAASFDFVNAWGCLMHMPDTEGAIREIHRVLRPKGRAFAYMYNRSSWPFWFNLIFLRGILMGKLITYHFDIDKLTSRYSDGYSVGGNMLARFYTPRQVEKMFKAAGFTSVQAFPFRIPGEPDEWPVSPFPVFKYLPRRIKRWMTRWGYGLLVLAEK